MTIGIDARMYREGLGIGRYLEQLIAHLLACESEHSYILFLRKRQMSAFRSPSPRIRTVRIDIPWYSLAEQLVVPLLLLRHKVDLMHFPHFNVPILYPGPFVVTIHDCIMLTIPASARSAVTTHNPAMHWIKHQAFRFVFANAVRRARMVITVSGAVREELVRRFGIERERTRVIHEAPTPLPRSTGSLPDEARQPYIFSAGNAYPHKNLERLVDAMIMFHGRHPDTRLIHAGQDDELTKRFTRMIEAKGAGSFVRHVGRVDDAILSMLYQSAVAFVFPSLIEGFGLPPLEAMRCGIPVCASDIPVLREVLGDAALFFNPRSINDILGALERICTDQPVRAALIERGYSQVSRYSWERTAQATVQAYTEALL